MTQATPLFLLGGSPAYSAYVDEFVAAAGGAGASIVALAQNQAGWEKYQAEIVTPWRERGVARIVPIVPGNAGALDLETASQALQAATGIFICGGHTPTYQRLFASEPLRSLIRARHQAGAPVAGVSAGALISLEICPLPRSETGEKLTFSRGLGLAGGFVIGVHFRETHALPEVLEAMVHTRIPLGYGIDEPAGIVCENGRFAHPLGESVYRIAMTDFEKETYQMLPLGADNPYEHCPVYETHQFTLRLIQESDAEELLDCYSDAAAARVFNSDNCTSNFIYHSVEEMKSCVQMWVASYQRRDFVRFSIIDKAARKVIGTVEFFARPETFPAYGKVGVLRIDLASRYETEGCLAEILGLVASDFYRRFSVDSLLTKAIPEAAERIRALKAAGYQALENNPIMPYPHYYLHPQPGK